MDNPDDPAPDHRPPALGHAPVAPSSPTLTLVVASIVVLAVVSSHSGRGHDRG